MELFDIIPKNFFSMLSAKNKKLYAACIFQVFKAYEQSSIMGIDRKIILDDLTDFLDKYLSTTEEIEYSYDDLDEVEETFDKTNTREIAGHVLRKMEKTGWIFVDVSNDYVENLNFTDYAITLIESLLNIQNKVKYADDDFDTYSPEEFHGYVFIVYSLLISDSNDYPMIVSEVLKNSRLLVRFLRKIDYRLKQYITSVVDNNEIKDLMDKLLKYKSEIFEESYMKIKTNDNINKYRLVIVQNLEKILDNEEALYKVTKVYESQFNAKDDAIKQVYKDINEIIEIFNTLDEMVTEIDNKIKTYINSTIGKIKFLLNEDDNIIGKLNAILKHIRNNAHDDKKLDKAIDLISTTTTLRNIKEFSRRGFYAPRGLYVAPPSQKLDTSSFDLTKQAHEIFKTSSPLFNEEYIKEFMEDNINNNEILASNVVSYDADDDTVMCLIHAIIYSNQNGYTIHKKDDLLKHSKFYMVNFILRKEGQ